VSSDPNLEKIAEATKQVTLSLDADVFAYFGPISEPHDSNFVQQVRANKRKTNALLILQTNGGSADAAYRMVKCLQRCYDKGKTYIFIDGPCKSAGTLMAVGATELIMSDDGELGPLDVQLQKKDEVGEVMSGLTATQALMALRAEAFNCFEQHLLLLRKKSGFQITTKTAAEIASELTVGWFQPMYEQIDPMRIAENQRSMMVAVQYGGRLNRGNLRENALDALVASYPSHGFIIDREEARQLFHLVRTPSEAELKLAQILEETGCIKKAMAGEQPILGYISDGSTEKDQTKGATDEPSTAKSGRAKAKAKPVAEPTAGDGHKESTEDSAAVAGSGASASLFFNRHAGRRAK
jgi:hypothetical protein